MLIDGPNFSTAFRQVFDLFDSLDEDDQSDLYPILEACCAADDSNMPPSALSTQWTRLTYHARTKRWATDAWARHSEPVKQAHSDQEDPLSPAALAPSAQLKDLFGLRWKRQAGEPARTATKHN